MAIGRERFRCMAHADELSSDVTEKEKMNGIRVGPEILRGNVRSWSSVVLENNELEIVDKYIYT